MIRRLRTLETTLRLRLRWMNYRITPGNVEKLMVEEKVVEEGKLEISLGSVYKRCANHRLSMDGFETFY